MIKAHKIRTLQLIFQNIWNDVVFINSRLETDLPSEDDVEVCAELMNIILENIVLFKANYSEFFGGNKGVKIRD